MARHLIYEAMLDPFEPPSTGALDDIRDRLTAELAKSGTVVVLVYQENETQVDDKEEGR